MRARTTIRVAHGIAAGALFSGGAIITIGTLAGPDELELHFESKNDLDVFACAAREALARWDQPGDLFRAGP